jgi:hypothetical protein
MHRNPLRKIPVDLHGSPRSPAPAVATPTTKLLEATIGSIRLGSLFRLTFQQIIASKE